MITPLPSLTFCQTNEKTARTIKALNWEREANDVYHSIYHHDTIAIDDFLSMMTLGSLFRYLFICVYCAYICECEFYVFSCPLQHYAYFRIYLSKHGSTAQQILSTKRMPSRLQELPADAATWTTLGKGGGVVVEMETFTMQYDTVQCFEKALELLPQDAEVWVHLGRLGGGRVGHVKYDASECFERALIEDVEAAGKLGAWFDLAQQLPTTWQLEKAILGVTNPIRGVRYSEAKCYEKALEVNAQHTAAWWGLGSVGGGTISGQRFEEHECYAQYLALEPNEPLIWRVLGDIGGSVIGGVHFGAKECLEMALGIESTQRPNIAATGMQPFLWYERGVSIGREDLTAPYTKKECFERTLTLDPWFQLAWFELSKLGGGEVRRIQYGTKQCYAKALDELYAHAKSWEQLAELGGGEVNSEVLTTFQCHEKAQAILSTRRSAEAAVEQQPTEVNGWKHLAVLGGGVLRGKHFSAMDAYQMARRIDINANFSHQHDKSLLSENDQWQTPQTENEIQYDENGEIIQHGMKNMQYFHSAYSYSTEIQFTGIHTYPADHSISESQTTPAFHCRTHSPDGAGSSSFYPQFFGSSVFTFSSLPPLLGLLSLQILIFPLLVVLTVTTLHISATSQHRKIKRDPTFVKPVMIK